MATPQDPPCIRSLNHIGSGSGSGEGGEETSAGTPPRRKNDYTHYGGIGAVIFSEG